MAIVKASTGEYDDSRTYTAWELCGDGWWEELGYSARIIGGRVLWEAIGNDGGQLVRLQRLVVDKALRTMTRYVDPQTPMRLVKDAED